MTQFKYSDRVRVLPPFDVAMPEEYAVEGIDSLGQALIGGGSSFADEYLTLVEVGIETEPTAVSEPRLITPYAMRMRFTVPEQVAVEMASTDSPGADQSTRVQAATLRVFMSDLLSVNQVDLALPAVVEAIGLLESYGLIGPGRAAEILTAPIQPVEAVIP